MGVRDLNTYRGSGSGGGSAVRGREFNTPSGARVRDLNTTPGAGLGTSRGAYRNRGIERHHSWRGDRRHHRRVFRSGIYVDPYASYAYTDRCHRHVRGARVLRHCHPYAVRWHHHGRWR
jgi:hypothetical protein